VANTWSTNGASIRPTSRATASGGWLVGTSAWLIASRTNDSAISSASAVPS
jgi:hypothetical protein